MDTTAAIKESGRIDRVRNIKTAIEALESDDLSIADAEKLCELLRARPSEAEEAAANAIVSICRKAGNHLPKWYTDIHGCGTTHEHITRVLEPFPKDVRRQIIEAADVRHAKELGLIQ